MQIQKKFQELLNIQKIILLEASEEVIINHLSKRDDKTYSVMQIVALKEVDFGENVTLEFRIKKGSEEAFDKKLQDLSNGRVSFTCTGEVIAGE